MERRNRTWFFLLAGTLAVIGSACSCSNSSNNGGGQPLSPYEEMRIAEKIPDPLLRGQALIKAARLFIGAQDTSNAGTCLSQAEQAIEEGNDGQFPADAARAYADLADAWAAAGRERDAKKACKEAEDLLDKIENNGEKSGVLIDMARVKIKIGEEKKARADLQTAEQAFDKMLLLERFDLLETFTGAFVALKDSDEAKRAVNDALEVANAQGSPSEKAPLLAVVGRVQYLQLEDQPLGQATLDEALTIAKSIPDKNKQANVMYDIAEDYFKLGQADRACGILSEAKDLVRELSEGQPILLRIEQLQVKKGC